ncbi:hypothetical protein ACLOJK_002367 [Asimina triloba]
MEEEKTPADALLAIARRCGRPPSGWLVVAKEDAPAAAVTVHGDGSSAGFEAALARAVENKEVSSLVKVSPLI